MDAVEPRSQPPREAQILFANGLAAMHAGARPAAASYFRRVLMIVPHWAEARFNLGCIMQGDGDYAGAETAYRRCLADDPEHGSAGFNLGILCITSGRLDEALALYTRLAERYPDNPIYRANRAEANLRRHMAEASRAVGEGYVRILLACMPKSGSTLLAQALGRLPTMYQAHLVSRYGRREQELCLVQLDHHRHMNYVAQVHLKPSDATQELIGLFTLRPVFLYRNIWDVMTSLRDHLMRSSMDWSMARFDPAYRSWDEAKQYDFLAHAMMPWFVDFYASWWVAPDRLAVSYEELIADPVETVMRVATWAGLPAERQDVSHALAKVGQAVTFNKGGSGRGSAVPDSARAHVAALTSYHPSVDFAPLLGS